MQSAAAPHGLGYSHAERSGAICCDVLDAWFEPSPRAVRAFAASGAAMRTSPDLALGELTCAISEARGIDPECISFGAGSSEIVHRVLPRLVGSGPVVILDPSYSEYPFVLGDRARPLPLCEASGFQIHIPELIKAAAGASAIVLVNPNNPTGQLLTRVEILAVKAAMQPGSVLWVDEAYIDFCPSGASVEKDACSLENLYVVKSLSKAYALSGIRAAYLVSRNAFAIKSSTPPWIIGTSAQAAAAAAVLDSDYYSARHRETNLMLKEFTELLTHLGLQASSHWIGAVLIRLPDCITASQAQAKLASAGLIVRTPGGMGEVLGDRYIRVSLPAKHDLLRAAEILGEVLI